MVTKEHRFLTPTGWEPLKHLTINSLVAVDGIENAFGCQGITKDLLSTDSTDFHPCDVLHSPLAAHIRDLSSQFGDSNTYLDREFLKTLHYELCIDDFQPLLVRLFSLVNSLKQESFLQFLHVHQNAAQDRDSLLSFLDTLLSLCQQLQASDSTPSWHQYDDLKTVKDILQKTLHTLSLQQYTSQNNHTQTSQPLSPETLLGLYQLKELRFLCHDFLSVLELLICSSQFPLQYQQSSSLGCVAQLLNLSQHQSLKRCDLTSLIPKNVSFHYTWASIKKIEFCRKDFFYDLHVPFYEHYVAEGFVNHNSGKTAASGLKAVHLSYLNSGYQGAVYSPSHGLAMDTMVPAVEFALELMPIRWEFRASPLPKFIVYWNDENPSEILVRSFENWQKIRGLNLAWAIVDEIDVVNRKISDQALRLLMGRIRTGNVRQLAFSSTPEGFGLMYDFFVTDANKGDRRIIHAKTTDNPHLPPDYLQDLLANYPANLVDAYINGQFVNLMTATAYHTFDRHQNGSNESVQPNDRLYIGQDFNVGKMASVVLVKRGETYHAVDEFFGMHDSSHTIYEINNKYPQHRKELYPDVSGNQRHTSASQTDLDLFAQAGFQIVRGKVNPAIRDRVNCVNTAFKNGLGVSKLFINPLRCPNLVRCLEQQALGSDGKPEKKNDLDHLPESLGYVVFWCLPVSGHAGFGTSRARG